VTPTGTDIRRLSKLGGQWKIVERSISDDLSSDVALHTGPVEEPAASPWGSGNG
jgi:hypothetical protein